MKFARYWTRRQGEATDSDRQTIEVSSRGWSDVSLEDAAARAGERARRLAERIATDRNAAKLYDYGDSPVPEPIVHDFRPEGAAAVVTRNSYGSLVLNTDELLFADVDTDSRHGALDQAERVAGRHGFSLRAYQTAAGYRLMVTNRRVRGGGDEAESILQEFGSDPLYMRLCRTQQSFRARLTPKPWRAGTQKPPSKFPFEGPAVEAAFRRWEEQYNRGIAGYATCRLIKTVGSEVDPGFTALIEHHDRETKAASTLPLA
ncbi:MAG TPA: hypothetical protein VHW09_22830 [Bryobacteraceae bacterium]|jgi:hypothetical protein|nr:hypothetical protein [Bryobacteraceae bacterium]